MWQKAGSKGFRVQGSGFRVQGSGFRVQKGAKRGRRRPAAQLMMEMNKGKLKLRPLRRLQNLLRRFCKRRIQKPGFSIQNTGDVFYYSDLPIT